MSSYLQKTHHKYWILEEALKDKISGRNLSIENALNSLRSDLDFLENETAQAWKANWKSLTKDLVKNTEDPRNNTYNTTINNNGTMNNFIGGYIDDSSFTASQNSTKSSQNSQEGSIDIGFPSDLSKDYHPRAEEDYYYTIDNEIDHSNANIGASDLCKSNDRLREFRAISLKMEPKSLSDLRLLSLNYIYLFTEDAQSRITSYLDEEHYNIMQELLNDPVPQINERCITWCTNVSMLRLKNWYEVQDTTIPFLNDAMISRNEHPEDLIIANILHRAALTLSNRTPDSDIEDSFIHHFISNLFDTIFLPESILNTAWANGHLGGKRKNEDEEGCRYKPDFTIFVKQRSARLDITCGEAKSPVNKSVFPKSDLVKLGQEMKWMLNTLIREGVDDPVVGDLTCKLLK